MKVKFQKAGMRRVAYTVASMLLLGVTATACSDSDDVLSEETEISNQTYIQLQVQIPNSSATRADAEDSGTTESGSEDEYTVKLAYIYLFDANDGSYKGEYQTSMIRQTSPSYGEAVTDGIYWQGQVTAVAAGSYHAYVLINTSLSSSTSFSTEKDFLALTKSVTGSSHISLNTSTGIPMSSRDSKSGICYATVSPNATEHNSAQKACQFTVSVERSYAKISFQNDKNKFNLYNTNTSSKTVIGTVELVSYKIFNMSSEYFLFRHVADLENGSANDFGFGVIGTVWNDGEHTGVRYPYLFDPNSFEKRIESNGSANVRFYTGMNVPAGQEGTTITATTNVNSALDVPSSYTAMQSSAFTLGYCLENAMAATNQKKGYATGIFFRAKITPTEYYVYDEDKKANVKYTSEKNPHSGDLYFNEGKFYTTLKAVQVDKGTMELTEENRSLYAVYYYKYGYCYYRHFIKHYDNNNDQEMGQMEYAIVRNNSYQLQVNSVSMPALEADTVNISEDVEMEQVYMQAHVTVLPWTVRVNQMELGGY